jgi:hypothetical protein
MNLQGGKNMKRLLLGAALAALVFALPAGAFNHKQGAITTCTVSATSVTGVGLPTNGDVINILFFDASGNYLGGYVIGGLDETSDGSIEFSLSLPYNPVPAGTAKYVFASETWGNASKPQFVSYSECAA